LTLPTARLQSLILLGRQGCSDCLAGDSLTIPWQESRDQLARMRCVVHDGLPAKPPTATPEQLRKWYGQTLRA